MFAQLKTPRILGSILILATFALFGAGYLLTSAAAELALSVRSANAEIPADARLAQTIATIRAKTKPPLPNSIGSFTTSYGSLVITEDGHISLRVPLLFFVVALLMLGVGVGLVLFEDAYGMLLDPNSGCASLSRAQAFVWSAVILGGYAAMTLFNLFFGASYATPAIDLYPVLDGTLLTLLGVVAASPVASTYISKQTPGKVCPAVSGLQGSFIRFAQLFTDDGAGTDPPLTISRMQCVLMTLVLATCYLAFLMQSVCILEPSMFAAAYNTKAYFTHLPDTGTSFLTLLIASHAIFQGSKANIVNRIFTTA